MTIDEAPRFLDQPTDLGDVLARSREYGTGMTLIAHSLRQFPDSLREVALGSARSKVAFGTSASRARRSAEGFGPGVEPGFFTGLARYEAIGCRRHRVAAVHLPDRGAGTGQEQGVQGVFPLVVFVTSTPERQAMRLDLLTFVPTEDWRLFTAGQLADGPRLLMGIASRAPRTGRGRHQ